MADYIRKIQRTLPNHRLYVLGDFNAHLAGNVAATTNENGHLLLELCRDYGLFIIPTQGPTWHRQTPDGQQSAVDYILTSHSNATTLVRQRILDTMLVNSDHHVVEAVFAWR